MLGPGRCVQAGLSGRCGAVSGEGWVFWVSAPLGLWVLWRGGRVWRRVAGWFCGSFGVRGTFQFYTDFLIKVPGKCVSRRL